MAIQAQAPVVPVAVTGGRAAMRKGSPVVRPVTMRVMIGEPVETTGLTVDDRDKLIAEVRTPRAGVADGRRGRGRGRVRAAQMPETAIVLPVGGSLGGGRTWTH